MDLVFVRPPGVAPGGFVLTPDSVWYCRVMLLFTASAMTDTGSKQFECAFVSVLETCTPPGQEHGTYVTCGYLWYYFLTDHRLFFV